MMRLERIIKSIHDNRQHAVLMRRNRQRVPICTERVHALLRHAGHFHTHQKSDVLSERRVYEKQKNHHKMFEYC
jgi:hypothetical protein